VELVFDLLPTSNILKAGHRIGVKITCVDNANYLTPALSPATIATIYRDANYVPYIIFPVISAS